MTTESTECTYIVPDYNDCRRCHKNEIMEPIGLKARHLNRDYAFQHGSENQANRNREPSPLLTDSLRGHDRPPTHVDSPSTGHLSSDACGNPKRQCQTT